MAEVEPSGGGDGGAVEKNAEPSVGTLSAMLQKRKAPEKAVAKRNSYSAAQKLAVVDEYGAQTMWSMEQFAQKKNIRKNQLWKWIKEEAEFRRRIADGTGKHQKARALLSPKTDAAVFLWFCEARRGGLPVTDEMLLMKAKHFAVKFDENLTGSVGWLEKFKARHGGLRKLRMQGELRSADHAAALLGVPLVQEKLFNYDDKLRLNADETGIYWRCLPMSSIVQAKEDAAGFKMLKERLSVLLVTSADGSIVEHFFIGKSKKPRCFAQKVL